MLDVSIFLCDPSYKQYSRSESGLGCVFPDVASASENQLILFDVEIQILQNIFWQNKQQRFGIRGFIRTDLCFLSFVSYSNFDWKKKQNWLCSYISQTAASAGLVMGRAGLGWVSSRGRQQQQMDWLRVGLGYPPTI